jgi:hypothetical protein
MINLAADNRVLTSDTKYSYLTTNYASGVVNINILNAADTFAANDYLLLGLFGSENAEIVQIDSVNASTGAIVLKVATKFAHSESTKVSILPYNQIRFYYNTTDTYSGATPLTGYVDIQASDWSSVYNDETNLTGFGWFIFYNSTTASTSQASNSLPYVGFENNTIEDILNDFYSLLNNKELKLVTRQDALSWLNEGYSKMRNRLNMTNVEYSATALLPLTILSGQTEYLLPDDFYALESITAAMDVSDPTAMGNMSKFPIEYIPLRLAFSYMGSQTRYYIRGKKIGFVPTPTIGGTYQYMYRTKTTRLDSNSDSVDLPDNGQFALKDFMMYRARMKFTDLSGAAVYFKAFNDSIDLMVIAAVDRDCALDTFMIDDSANC